MREGSAASSDSGDGARREGASGDGARRKGASGDGARRKGASVRGLSGADVPKSAAGVGVGCRDGGRDDASGAGRSLRNVIPDRGPVGRFATSSSASAAERVGLVIGFNDERY